MSRSRHGDLATTWRTPRKMLLKADSRATARLLAVALGVLTVLTTNWLPAGQRTDTPVMVGLLGFALLLGLLSGMQRLVPVMDRWAGVAGTLAVAGLVAATGGADSVYVDLYLIVVLTTAATRSTRRLFLQSAVVGTALLLPVVYAPSSFTTSTWVDLLVDTLIWAVVTGIVHWQAQHSRHQRRRLADTEAGFRRLTENSADGIYLLRLRPAVRFEYMNDGMEHVTGFPRQAFEDDPHLSLKRTHPGDLHKIQLLRERATELQQPTEIRFLDPDGNWRWLSPMAVPVLDRRGRVVAIHGSIRDISHHKRIEAQLEHTLARERAATQQLRAADRMKSSFLQALSHELRTPLTNVLGFAQTLRNHHGELTPAQLEDITGRMVRGAKKLNRLVDDLLDVDRLSRGVLDADRTPTDLAALCRNVLEGLPPNGHRVVLDTGPDGVAAVDGPKVERILENLLANAYKHTPNGTTIVVGLKQDAEVVELVVEDDGPGMDDRLKLEVFEPFTQGAQAQAAPSPGTGVGLALVRGFARLHGGDVRIEDRDGGGTRVVVSLPTATPEGASPAGAAPARNVPLHTPWPKDGARWATSPGANGQ